MFFFCKTKLLSLLIVNYVVTLMVTFTALKQGDNRRGFLYLPLLLSGLPPTPLFFIKAPLLFYLLTGPQTLYFVVFLVYLGYSWYVYSSALLITLELRGGSWVPPTTTLVWCFFLFCQIPLWVWLV